MVSALPQAGLCRECLVRSGDRGLAGNTMTPARALSIGINVAEKAEPNQPDDLEPKKEVCIPPQWIAA